MKRILFQIFVTSLVMMSACNVNEVESSSESDSESFTESETSYEYNKFIHLKGTEFSVATIESYTNRSSFSSSSERYVKSILLFINTMTGNNKLIEFAEETQLGIIQQIKFDDLGINLLLVVVNNVSLGNKKDSDWRDSKQIFVFSPSGDNMKQLTEDNFYVYSFSINEYTGTLIVSGYFDKNRNLKRDKEEKNEILLFDLKTRTLKKTL